jgi:hypothetical protein
MPNLPLVTIGDRVAHPESSTFQLGNSRLIDEDEIFVLLKGTAEKNVTYIHSKYGVSSSGVFHRTE